MARTAHGHDHVEAFCLMKYRADDGEEEILWNSRDGVTPFMIRLRSGKEASHVEWHLDKYAPDYIPPVGSRIFADLTEEKAREMVRERVEELWNHSEYPAHAYFESKKDFEEALTRDMLRAVQDHSPVVIEVREPWNSTTQ